MEGMKRGRYANYSLCSLCNVLLFEDVHQDGLMSSHSQSGAELSYKLWSGTVPIQNISQKYNWIYFRDRVFK